LKYLSTLVTGGIIFFWIAMNMIFFWRQFEMRKLDRYQRGVSEFLGNDLKRERWMGIYRQAETVRKKKGYTGLILEKIYGEEQLEFHVVVETFYRGVFPMQGLLSGYAGSTNSLKINGRMIFDRDFKPIHLEVKLQLKFLEGTSFAGSRVFFIRGDREKMGKEEQEKLLVKVFEQESEVFRLPLPLEGFTLSDGFSPVLPVAGFKVGETFQIRVFNPLGFLGSTATVRVLGQRTEEVNTVMVDVYELETEIGGTKTLSLVTEGGEIIQQQLGPPLGLILRYETSRRSARRGLDK
jgi:hypothetical protein